MFEKLLNSIMTPNLANYLFNKETLYRNAFVEAKPIEKKTIVAEKIEPKQETVITAIPQKEIVKQSLPTFVFKHKVLILTNTISESEKILLVKILGAIGLTLAQVDLIELSKAQILDYQSFIAQNVTQKVISFGVGLGKINWNILLNIYQPKNVSGVDFLLSDELIILDTNLDLKKILWGALKTMFAS